MNALAVVAVVAASAVIACSPCSASHVENDSHATLALAAITNDTSSSGGEPTGRTLDLFFNDVCDGFGLDYTLNGRPATGARLIGEDGPPTTDDVDADITATDASGIDVRVVVDGLLSPGVYNPAGSQWRGTVGGTLSLAWQGALPPHLDTATAKRSISLDPSDEVAQHLDVDDADPAAPVLTLPDAAGTFLLTLESESTPTPQRASGVASVDVNASYFQFETLVVQ